MCKFCSKLVVSTLTSFTAILMILFICGGYVYAVAEETAAETESSETKLIDISEAVISLSESSYTYTGEQITPAADNITVTYGGALLSYGVDYEISYGDNMSVGVGTVTVSGIGKFTGESTVSFAIEALVLDAVTVKTDYDCTAESITIYWKKTENASGYRVLRYNDTSKDWKTVTDIADADTLVYHDSGLLAGTNYSYKIVAFAQNKIDGTVTYAPASSVITASTSPSKVTMSSKYSSTASAIRINWEKSTGATGYKIYRYNSSAKKWDVIQYIYDVDTLTYRDSGLAQGELYRYRVQAFKNLSDGESLLSDMSSVFKASTAPSKVTMQSNYSKSTSAVRIYWDVIRRRSYLLSCVSI